MTQAIVSNGRGILEVGENGIAVSRLPINAGNFIWEDTARWNVATSDLNPTIHFATQGDWLANNHIDGYYIFWSGDEISLGRIVNGDPSSITSPTIFSREPDVDYKYILRRDDWRIRFKIWNANQSEPSGWLIDHTLSESNRFFSSGEFAWKNAYSGLGGRFEISEIKITFGAGEATEVTSFSIDQNNFSAEIGDTGTLTTTTQGTNVTGDATFESSDSTIVSVDNDGNWEVLDEGTVTITATSTDDENFTDTVEIEGIPVQEPGTFDDSEQGDRDTLHKLWVDTGGQAGEWRNNWDENTILNGDLETLHGVRLWESGENEGRVRSLKLNGTETFIVDHVRGHEGIRAEFDSDGVDSDGYIDEHITEVGGNGLVGEIYDVPWGNLTRMEYMNLSHNSLKGEIPWHQYKNMKMMKYCFHNLHHRNDSDWTDPTDSFNSGKTSAYHEYSSAARTNQFTGGISPDIEQMESLVVFECMGRGAGGSLLGQPGLTGGVPGTIQNLQDLHSLYLHHNQLSFPDEGVFQAPSLYRLGMNRQGDALVGMNENDVLNNIDYSPSIATIQFSRGRIGGPFPDFSDPDKPTSYIGSWQNHTGTFPQWMIDKGLRSINVSRNELDGEVPDLREDIDNRSLEYNHNNFTGPIRESHFHPSNSKMAAYSAYNNNLSGQMVTDLRHMYRFKRLRYSENDIDGQLPVVDFTDEREFQQILANSAWNLKESGTIDSGSAHEFTVNGAGWTPGEHVGKWIRYGDLVNQNGPQRLIISNTDDTIVCRSQYDIPTSWDAFQDNQSYEIGNLVSWSPETDGEGDPIHWTIDSISGDTITLTGPSLGSHRGDFARHGRYIDEDGPGQYIESNSSNTITIREWDSLSLDPPQVGDTVEIGRRGGESATGGNATETFYADDCRHVPRDFLFVYEGKTLLEWWSENENESDGPGSRSLRLFPQRPFGPKPFGSTRVVSTPQGQTLTYDELDGDYVSHEDNVYEWERQSGSIKSGVTTDEATISISDFQSSDEGNYRLKVTNPNIPGEEFFSEFISFELE